MEVRLGFLDDPLDRLVQVANRPGDPRDAIDDDRIMCLDILDELAVASAVDVRSGRLVLIEHQVAKVGVKFALGVLGGGTALPLEGLLLGADT